ncbi:MAG: hypothetical protein IT530_19770 [Burkholderiales bacterium]|nr:hypothetical protein [Burkholderiales bacterium]
MGRDGSGKNGHLRERIAHLAARIMAEDGVDDFGYAKRKAARQAGARDAKALPDNEEVEHALAAYRSLYQRQEHPPLLLELRAHALTVMRMLARFKPHLTGPVLSGVAGRHSDIDLQLFAENTKEVEIFLLNRGVRYRATQVRVYLNNGERVVPGFSFEHDAVEVRLTVFDAHDLRHSIRATPTGRPLERAPIAAVEELLGGVDQSASRNHCAACSAK